MKNEKQNGDGALVMIAIVAASVVAMVLVVLTQACAALPGAILGLQARI
jgi:hypothetical protein